MNALERLHINIDQNDWDDSDRNLINQAFQNVNDELTKENNEDLLHLSEVERQAFAFNKSPKENLSFKLAGDKTLEDGTIVRFEWPDVRAFSSEDFSYLIERFKKCKNTFAQSEYGLVAYYADQLKRNDDVLVLIQTLFKLAKSYIAKAKEEDSKNYYILYCKNVLANALHIAKNRKKDPSIHDAYDNLIHLTFEVHQHWNVDHKTGLRTAIDFTDFAIQYFNNFEQVVDVFAFITKNWEAAEHLAQTDSWGAIYVADISIRLCKKMNRIPEDWLIFKANQYEKLATEAQKQSNMAAVSFIEEAMNIYKDLKNEDNLHRLQGVYQQLRSDFHLGEIRQEMPQEETQRIIQYISRMVKDRNEEELVKILSLTPMVRPLADIRQLNEDLLQDNPLRSIIPTNVQDTFGNTIATYNTDEERKKFSLLDTYGLHMQIAVQTLLQLFIEAFRAGKISTDAIVAVLKETWLGQNNTRRSSGREININYLTLIESGLKSLFAELHQWNSIQGYLPNLVSATDSLVLKAEYLLREFVNRLGLPTFKPNPRNSAIIMEKTLDDLLNVLEGELSEDDHFFIKFVLTEKAGYNLRHRIAHGLMDNIDYGLEYPVLALIIILKLSSYQFIEEKNI